MEIKFDDRVKEFWPLKNGNLTVGKQDDEGSVKNKSGKHHAIAFGSFILRHSKRIMNIVIRELGNFYNSNVYYTDTDSAYIHKKHWSSLVDTGFVDDGFGLDKND